MKIDAYITEQCKKDEFKDGTLGTCRRSLLCDRVIFKNVSGLNFQSEVIKMDIVIVSYLIMSIFEGTPDRTHDL